MKIMSHGNQGRLELLLNTTISPDLHGSNTG